MRLSPSVLGSCATPLTGLQEGGVASGSCGATGRDAERQGSNRVPGCTSHSRIRAVAGGTTISFGAQPRRVKLAGGLKKTDDPGFLDDDEHKDEHNSLCRRPFESFLIIPSGLVRAAVQRSQPSRSKAPRSTAGQSENDSLERQRENPE